MPLPRFIKPAGFGAATVAPALPTLTSPAFVFYANASNVTLSGSNVTTWNDTSGNGNNATGGSSPTWNATGLNGLPIVLFNASKYLDAANSSSLQISTGMTYYAVAKYTNFSDNNHDTIVAKGTHGIGLNYIFGKANSVFNNAQKFTYVDSSSFRNVIESTLSLGTNNQFYVWSTRIRKSAGIVDFYRNGTLLSSVTDSFGLNYFATNTTGLRIGMNNAGSEGLDGAIAYVAIDRTEHSDSTIASNVAGLRALYGI